MVHATDEDIETYQSDLNHKVGDDKGLYLSALSSLKSISQGKTHHQLIYTNSQEASCKVVKFLSSLVGVFDINGLYFSNYNSSMSSSTHSSILKSFKESPAGVIVCVYCLGEGWDFPLLDGVVFAENMSSNVRIVQSALRPCRKSVEQPNKKAYIILPIIQTDDWLDCANPNFKKIKKVLGDIGHDDSSIEQRISIEKLVLKDNRSCTHKSKGITTQHENDEETSLNFARTIKLKIFSRQTFGVSYLNAKTIISTHCIGKESIHSLEGYKNLCAKEHRLPCDPHECFGNNFISWVDYLGIQGDYYDYDTCSSKLTDYINLESDTFLSLEESIKNMCGDDSQFPPYDFWKDYYKVTNINDMIKKSATVESPIRLIKMI